MFYVDLNFILDVISNDVIVYLSIFLRNDTVSSIIKVLECLNF